MAIKQGHSGGDVNAIILVDVDGVLNVGAADEGKTPILFNDTNLRFAQRIWNHRANHPERETVEKLLAISQKKLCRGEPEGQTMASLTAKTPSHVSEVLVERLAQIVKACGPKSMVVLSSTWQAAKHQRRVQQLERMVSRYAGRDFRFDASTGSIDDKTPEGRLEAISNFVAAATAPGGAASEAAANGSLRILVLEDFFITPLSGGWSCRGVTMDSARAVECLIEQKLPSSASLSVKLIHTYDEWRASSGDVVRCGVGLSADDVERSKAFLVHGPVVEQIVKQVSAGSLPSAGVAVSEDRASEDAGVSLGFFGLSCFNSDKADVKCVTAR